MTNSFLLGDNDLLTDLGGDRAKYYNNIEAIKVAKRIGAGVATPSEQNVLSHYTGWGSTPVLRYAFPQRNTYDRIEYSPMSDEIKELALSDDEIRSMRASSLNAHYTSISIIKALWKVLIHIGVTNLKMPRFLEPSAGIGHFFSAMPVEVADRSKRVAVELDKLTAEILRLLHPDTTVHNCGFEFAPLPLGYFDVVLSNIPFGDYPVLDKGFKSNYLKASIHDYFFAKAIEIVRPGGIVAFITSRYTMDKTDNRLRTWMADRVDLLGMVRLPDNAFTKNAGTKVVTDIVILRKKDATSVAGQMDWRHIEMQRLPARDGYSTVPIAVNQAYNIHPEWVLGKPVLQHGMYGDNAYTVEPDGRNVEEELVRILTDVIPKDILSETSTVVEQVEQQVAVRKSVFFMPETATEIQKLRMVALKNVYDTAKALLDAEINGKVGVIDELRITLNREYDGFVAFYGPINSPANLKFLRDNPALPFLKALEAKYDPAISEGTKATIFQHTIVRGNLAAQNWIKLTPIERAQEALVQSLDKKGCVDIPYIARLSDDTSEGVTSKLIGRIFYTPEGVWETAEEYLSGNVRKKLDDARKIASVEPETYGFNVQELEKIQPAALGSGDISARLGASWIPAPVIGDFVKDIVGGFVGKIVHLEAIAQWSIELDNRFKYRLSDNDMFTKWGTSRRAALDLLDDALNMKIPVIRDSMGEGMPSVVNQTQTVAAQAKLAEIKDRFNAWVWEDVDRTKLLTSIYNEKFNNLRPRHYDGKHLSLRGFNSEITLLPHQLDAIWRSIQSKTTLLGHVVGAGKTFCMICSAMEMLRLGIAKKAMVVVPNHLTEQWAADILRAYPDANVLCGNKNDLSKTRRGEFMSKIATNSWDIVVIPSSSFKLLPVSLDTNIEFTRNEIGQLNEALTGLAENSGSRQSQKQIEKAIKRLEVNLQMMLDMKKDDTSTITYEELGVDLLMVDEFHYYKNLFFATRMTRVPGLPNTRSQRAIDMFMKIRWTLDQGGRAICATGTPVANTLAEVYTMMRYLQLELLEEQGIATFDAWAQNFAEVVPSLEMTPDGSGFRMNSRFAKFVNLPELATMWRQVLDVRTAEQLNLPRPKLHTGRPLIVASQGSGELDAYIKSLVERVEGIKHGVPPWIDNMLKITGDGRKAALDMRLVVAEASDNPGGKINTCVTNVVRIWEGSKPRNGVQLIFCDLGTPKKIRPVEAEEGEEVEVDPTIEVEGDDVVDLQVMNDVYNEIKRKLIKLGIPDNEVRFIHDCKTPAQRSEMFGMVRAGVVRVLIGSTEKMGTGMNVQNLLVALHNLDAPWRPADIEQREGRMMRRGNEYPEVAIFNYVTEGSFDGYVWQTLETKARFISQIMAGEITARTAEDVGDMVLTMSAVKALASGNPKVMQKVALETELTKMSHLMAAWRSSKSNMQFGLVQLPNDIKFAAAESELHHAVYANVKAHEDTEFSMKLVSKPFGDTMDTFTKRESAGKRLHDLAEMCYQNVKHDQMISIEGYKFIEVGSYKGFKLCIKAFANPLADPEVWPIINDEMISYYSAKVTDTTFGVIQSMDMQLRDSAIRYKRSLELLNIHKAKQKLLEVEIDKPWEHAEKYDRMRRNLAILDLELQSDNVHIETSEVSEEEGAVTEASFSIAEIIEWLRELHDPNFKVKCEVVVAPVVDLVAPNAVESAITEAAIAEAEAKIDEKQAVLIFTELKRTGVKKRTKGYQVPDSQIGFGW